MVIYHFWPKVLPGGFIGVDVFFVISGFLITSHLLTKPPRRIRDVGQFWIRRVKRLLPASFLVILVSLLGVWLLAPETLWQDWGLQAIASTFYFQNWFLATSKVNYLAEADAPSPFQHFWSLSTEEQFYLVWPILIGLLVLLAIRWGKKTQPVTLTGIAFIFATSLGYSVYAYRYGFRRRLFLYLHPWMGIRCRRFDSCLRFTCPCSEIRRIERSCRLGWTGCDCN
ncbi:hypothetical protein AA310_07400 [Arthrobacter sp. YC-RL1]|nr:hypothetical protein ATC04_10505 [Arthrobacter sp. YC-RL1]KLI87763.1 hypothetical protein AA310_07400 [Arthrobacter sp. YC-RL1]